MADFISTTYKIAEMPKNWTFKAFCTVFRVTVFRYNGRNKRINGEGNDRFYFRNAIVVRCWLDCNRGRFGVCGMMSFIQINCRLSWILVFILGKNVVCRF